MKAEGRLSADHDHISIGAHLKGPYVPVRDFVVRPRWPGTAGTTTLGGGGRPTKLMEIHGMCTYCVHTT